MKSKVNTEEGPQILYTKATLALICFVIVDGFPSALTSSPQEMTAGWLGQGPSEVVWEASWGCPAHGIALAYDWLMADTGMLGGKYYCCSGQTAHRQGCKEGVV